MQSSSKLYLSRLDHLRFLAAFIVLVYHTIHSGTVILVPTDYVPEFALFPLSLVEEGFTGVALFMVLSGFIFMALCRDKEIVYADFLRNRLLRIAPLFLFWLSLTFLMTPSMDVGRVLLTMPLNPMALTGVGWTVVLEFQFYFLFPFLVTFYRRGGVRFLLGVLALAVATRAVLYFGPMRTDHKQFQQIAYASLFGRIDQFVLGMLACEAYHRWPALFRSRLLFVGSIVGWLLFFHQVNRWGGYGYENTSGKQLWIFLSTLEGLAYGLWTACWLGCPWTLPRWLDDSLAWLGKLSFSFYLNHVMLIPVCAYLAAKLHLLPTTFNEAVLFTGCFVLPVVTLFSALSYHVIELPFLSMRRNYLLPLTRDDAGPKGQMENPPSHRAAA